MVGHGGSSAGSYLADPTSPIPSHCASIVATSTLRVNRKYTSCAVLFPALPLPSNSVDSIVCDLPFGVQHLTVEKVKDLYPKALAEMHRYSMISVLSDIVFFVCDIVIIL